MTGHICRIFYTANTTDKSIGPKRCNYYRHTHTYCNWPSFDVTVLKGTCSHDIDRNHMTLSLAVKPRDTCLSAGSVYTSQCVHGLCTACAECCHLSLCAVSAFVRPGLIVYILSRYLAYRETNLHGEARR